MLREGKDGDGDREVEMGAIFGELGRGEINCDFTIWKGEAGVDEGATDTLAGFVDGFGCHADDIKGGEAFI